MTRAELEAAIWLRWPTRGPEARDAVYAILKAADEYRMCQGPAPHPDPIIQGRRDALEAELDRSRK